MNIPISFVIVLLFAALAAVFVFYPSLKLTWPMSGGVPMAKAGRILVTVFQVVMSAFCLAKDHSGLKVVILNVAGIIMIALVPAYFHDRRVARSPGETGG